MSLLKPHFQFQRIYDIPVDFWKERGITALLLDVDNTLTTHNNPQPHANALAWLELQRQSGIRLMILSNNSKRRIEPFAQVLQVGYIASAAKPFPRRLRHALRQLGVRPEETAIIGDQLFTDVLCGRLAGCLSVLVEPFASEHHPFFRLKRWLERGILGSGEKSKKERKG